MVGEHILSLGYRATRRAVITGTYINQTLHGKKRHLEDAVDIGDTWFPRMPESMTSFDIPEGIGVNLYDMHFPSPITIASFKQNINMLERWLGIGAGGACYKTIMFEKRDGNKKPRIQEVGDDLINAMGLPGHGLEEIAQEFWGSSLFHHNKPIGLSIGGSSLEEYKANFARMNTFVELGTIEGKVTCPVYFEINISCPNTPEGQQMGKNPALLRELLTYMRERTGAVIGVKLSPDMPNDQLIEFANLVKTIGRTYVNLGNTQYKKCIDLGLAADAISIGGGGFSGPSLLPRTKDMVAAVYPVGVPIIATGGASTARDVLELQKLGATLVGMATQVVKDPYRIPIINKQLAKAA